MKEGFIHITFVLDESGSMYPRRQDVVGGFEKIIDEQLAVKEGSCAVSLYKFSDNVEEVFVGKPISDVSREVAYDPHGCTAMNDGIGTAIDNVGRWLAAMDEAERPSKNLVVIMTDGYENASKEYTIERVREMIKHQEDKYSWEFMYVGMDITKADDAKSLGICNMLFTDSTNIGATYGAINTGATLYRCCAAVDEASTQLKDYLAATSSEFTAEYEREKNITIE